MLNPAIQVKKDSVIEGAGLVADRLIPEGDVLFRFDDINPPAHLHELVDWPPQRRIRFLAFAIQIGEDDYAFRQGDIKFINHSCDPTGWWSGYGTLIARRDIHPGEEITYDYSTSDITLKYRMECLCGTESCRGIVTNQDYLDPDFQKKYAGHIPEHVMAAIDRARSAAPVGTGRDTVDIPAHVIEAVQQARQKAPALRLEFGNQYIFEMVKLAVHQVRSNNPGFRREHGDRYLYEMVRELILKN